MVIFFINFSISSKTRLSPEEHQLFGIEFIAYVDNLPTDVESTINHLDKIVPSANVRVLVDSFRDERFSLKDLRFIIAHHRFAQAHGLIDARTTMPIEVVRLNNRTFALTKTNFTLLGNLDEVTLNWAHNCELTVTRFLEHPHSELGDFKGHQPIGRYICGHWTGSLKFFSVADLESGVPSDIIRNKFGLQGDPFYAGELYLIRARVAQILEEINPRAAIAYNCLSNHKWNPYPKFLGEYPVVGFTSGGLGEVVGNTFLVEATDLEALRDEGVTIEKCED